MKHDGSHAEMCRRADPQFIVANASPRIFVNHGLFSRRVGEQGETLAFRHIVAKRRGVDENTKNSVRHRALTPPRQADTNQDSPSIIPNRGRSPWAAANAEKKSSVGGYVA